MGCRISVYSTVIFKFYFWWLIGVGIRLSVGVEILW